MSISFKTARNIGLGVLFLVLVVMCAFAYTALNTVVTQMYDMIELDRARAEKYADINMFFISTNKLFYDFRDNSHSVTALDDMYSLMDRVTLRCNALRHLCMYDANAVDVEQMLRLADIDYLEKRAKTIKHLAVFMRDNTEAQGVNEAFVLAVAQGIWQSGEIVQAIRSTINAKEKALIVQAMAAKRIVAIVLVIGGFICIIVGVFMHRVLSGPILLFVEATKRIASGDLTKKIEIHAGDEIGKLADAFNDMREQLQMTTVSRDTLLMAEARLSAIFHGSGDAMWVVDKDGIVSEMNNAMEKLSGIAAEDAIGKRCYELFCGESCQTEQCACSSIMHGYAERLEIEVLKYRKDGKKVPVEVVATALRSQGEVIGIIESFRDISLRKEAEAKVGEINMMFRGIIENSPSVIYLKDNDGRFMLVNPVFEQLFHFTNEQILGKTDYDLFPQETALVLRQNDKKVLDEGVVGIYDERICIDNIEHTYLSTKFPLTDVQGKAYGVCGVSTDITDRKNAEEELRSHREHLEELIKCRTKQLEAAKDRAEVAVQEIAAAHIDLKVAKVVADEANESKNRFIANISHEIRTPLNGIIGFAEMIAESDSMLVMHERAAAILKESETLVFLVNALLDHAKIKAGKMELELLPFKVVQLAEDLRYSFETTTQEKHLLFEIHIAGDVPPYIIGDQFRLRQVLANLISNAVKFTNEGSITLTIEQISVNANTTQLRFSVKDTGLGISPERQKAIFQSFTQADESMTRQYGGTGLGTTIAQELVHLMGGEMGLESELGKGSTFWFEVTCDKAYVIPEESSNDTAQQGMSAIMAGDGRMILVAEDYVPNQEVVRAHLEHAGYHVCMAENGEEAVAMCREQHFDLIIMDIQMPKLNGYDAAREILAQPVHQNTCIVAMTANVDAKTKQHCLDAGMREIITKPIRKMSFLTTVSRLVNGSNIPKQQEACNDGNMSEGQDDGGAVPLNYAQGLEEFMGNTMLFHNVLNQFIHTVDTQITTCKDALERKDIEVIRREAHKIRGGAANLTAMALARVAEQMELLAEANKLDDIASLMTIFEQECLRLKEYLKRLLK